MYEEFDPRPVPKPENLKYGSEEWEKEQEMARLPWHCSGVDRTKLENYFVKDRRQLLKC
jgi:hypothetical protein